MADSIELKKTGAHDAFCVVVTHHSLLNLRHKQHGTYKRLHVFLKAISATGIRMMIFCVTPDAAPDVVIRDVENEIQQQLAELWGIQAEVIAGRASGVHAASRLPWLFQQLLAAFNYSLSPLCSNLMDESSRDRLVLALSNKPAFVFAHRLPMMNFVKDSLEKNTPVYFDLDDIEHVAVARGLGFKSSLRDRIVDAVSIPALIFAELRAVTRASATFVCSSIDRKRAARWFFSRSVDEVPNVVDVVAGDLKLSPRPVLLFVGTYTYAPNRDAADYFIREIFPAIRRVRGDAEAWIVGGSIEMLGSYSSPPEGVNLLGYVDDIAQCYRSARVVVCPVRSGSGTRVKLIEAAAHGKPIVTTTVGAEGLEMVPDTHALFADDASTFADQCLRLLSDDATCLSLGRTVRDMVARKFDRKFVIERLTERYFRGDVSALG